MLNVERGQLLIEYLDSLREMQKTNIFHSDIVYLKANATCKEIEKELQISVASPVLSQLEKE